MTVSIKQLPLFPLFLNFLGMIFIGFGMAEKFARVNLIPEIFRYNNFEIHMIVFGVIIALPYFVWMTRNATSKANEV